MVYLILLTIAVVLLALLLGAAFLVVKLLRKSHSFRILFAIAIVGCAAVFVLDSPARTPLDIVVQNPSRTFELEIPADWQVVELEADSILFVDSYGGPISVRKESRSDEGKPGEGIKSAKRRIEHLVEENMPSPIVRTMGRTIDGYRAAEYLVKHSHPRAMITVHWRELWTILETPSHVYTMRGAQETFIYHRDRTRLFKKVFGTFRILDHESEDVVETSPTDAISPQDEGI